MQRYPWPGNIRQLENLMRSYVLMRNEEALVAELTQEPKPRESEVAEVDLSKPVSLKGITKRATQELERKIILKVLKANNWNRLKTAKWLKISYRSLLYKLNDVNLGEVHVPVQPGMGARPQHADGATGGSNSSPANGPALSSGVERSSVTP
jgi:two-component system response regulator AtoC